MPPKTRGGGGGGRGRGAGGDGGGRGTRGGRGGQQSRGQPRTVSQAQPGRGRGQGHGSRSVSQPVGDAPPPTSVPPVPSLPQMTQQAATVSETVQDAPRASVQRTQALAGATAVVFLIYFTNIIDQFIGPSTSSWLRYWRSCSQHFRQPLQACKYSRRKGLPICFYNPHKRWGCPNEGYGDFSLGKQRSQRSIGRILQTFDF